MSKLTTITATLAATGLLALGAGGTAVAGDLIGSRDIRDHSVQKVDLSKGVNAALAKAGTPGATGPAGPAGSDGSDGADGKDGKDGAPGISHLIAGSGYSTTWKGDGGDTLQTVREECPAGQYALGGGYSTWGGDKDLGGDNRNIVVTVSAPYFEGDYVPADDAGNFRPTEWVVKGYNLGTSDQIVRAWVTCANVAD